MRCNIGASEAKPCDGLKMDNGEPRRKYGRVWFCPLIERPDGGALLLKC